MFISLKQRIDEPEIQEILGYSVFPDQDHLERTVQCYKSEDNLELYGIESEDEIAGVIGFRQMDGGNINIEHIAVKPERRGEDYGRGLILELIAAFKPESITAETDEEAVEFYRAIGFGIESLGEIYPGVERYRCTYQV